MTLQGDNMESTRYADGSALAKEQITMSSVLVRQGRLGAAWDARNTCVMCIALEGQLVAEARTISIAVRVAIVVADVGVAVVVTIARAGVVVAIHIAVAVASVGAAVVVPVGVVLIPPVIAGRYIACSQGSHALGQVPQT